jgi:hypothetical protein
VRADIAQILQVPVAFFFEDDMPAGGDSKHMIASPNTIMDFMSIRGVGACKGVHENS